MKTKKTARDKALMAFQKLRRLEDANANGYVQCISCGKIMHYTEAQGGHYISRAVRATELEKDNVNPQCQRCNGFLSGNVTLYRINLVRKIGEKRVKRLEDLMQYEKGALESLERLSEEDLQAVHEKKGKVYYESKYKSYKEKIKELEEKQCKI